LTLEQFIDDALDSNTRDKTHTIKITEEACAAIKKHTKLNVTSYTFIMEEEYVRHIRNNHEEDLYLLNKLPEILNYFTHVEKSLTRNKRTGQNDVSFVFRKTFEDGVVRMVALRALRNKTLSLTTFFRP
jgi:hypothetical protein